MENLQFDRIVEILPNLRIAGEIKRGGQKVVYNSYYNDELHCVLKIIKANQREEKDRALREINILSSLKSEYFPEIMNCGEFILDGQNTLFLVEEFIPGRNLRDELIHTSGKLDLSECKRIMCSLMDSLRILAEQNLVHRDIKPENIIISDDRVVLVDFGIARDLDNTSLTETSALFGPMTPGYAPPEQIRNEKRKISFRTDLFSAAVVFYEILAGYNPFVIDTSSQIEKVQKVLYFNPPSLTSLGYNNTFDDFIFACLNKYCHRRPATMQIANSIFNNINWE